MGHFCRICKKERANEGFSGKGHARHVCRDCERLLRAEREHVEIMDELDGYLEQRNISEKNVVRLNTLARHPHRDICDRALSKPPRRESARRFWRTAVRYFGASALVKQYFVVEFFTATPWDPTLKRHSERWFKRFVRCIIKARTISPVGTAGSRVCGFAVSRDYCATLLLLSQAARKNRLDCCRVAWSATSPRSDLKAGRLSLFRALKAAQDQKRKTRQIVRVWAEGSANITNA